MKYLKVLILFFSFSILFQLTTTSVNAAECTIIDGEIDETGSSGVKQDCGTTPVKYEIIVYEAYLCTSEATIPTTSAVADLSMCSQIFENLDGAVASVVQNENIDLIGTRMRPNEGVYTHAYAKIDNVIGITWSGKIDGSMKSSSGNNNDVGQFCGTVVGTGNFGNGQQHLNSMICDTSAITPGKFEETMNSFSDDSNLHVFEETNIPGNAGASIKAVITTTDGFQSQNNGQSFRMEASMKNATQIIIDESTKGLTVKFSLVDALHLKEEGTNTDRIQASSGPFISIMTAQ